MLLLKSSQQRLVTLYRRYVHKTIINAAHSNASKHGSTGIFNELLAAALNSPLELLLLPVLPALILLLVLAVALALSVPHELVTVLPEILEVHDPIKTAPAVGVMGIVTPALLGVGSSLLLKEKVDRAS